MIRLTPIPCVQSARRLTRCDLLRDHPHVDIDLGRRWCENDLTHTRPPSVSSNFLATGRLGPISRSARRVERTYDCRTKH
jgi:hypothetical protein